MSKTLETIDDLKQKFPLFEYKATPDDKFVVVILQSGVTIYVHSELTGEDLITLSREHDEKKQWKVNMDKYPNLYFSRDCRAIWVRRMVNGHPHDGDGIPYEIPLTDDQLPHWNEEAGKAQQQGWFLCMICGKAKPRSEYGYYHFCAEYCKDCLKTHPEVERSARNENYE